MMLRHILAMKRQLQLFLQLPRMLVKARQEFLKKEVGTHSFWHQPDFSERLHLSSAKQASKAAAFCAQQITTTTHKITNCI